MAVIGLKKIFALIMRRNPDICTNYENPKGDSLIINEKSL